MRLLLILALTLPLMGQSIATWAPEREPVTLRYCVAKSAPAGASKQIQAALKEWAKYTEIKFRAGKCGTARTLTFSWLPSEHGDGYPFIPSVYAHAFYPDWPEPLAGDVHFSTAETWTPARIYTIALHEIGHSLGLRDDFEGGGVMYPYPRGYLWLCASDIASVRKLYARRCYQIECAMRFER